ncbi:hypothetical protein T3H97_06215 [Paenibacillus sp. LX16]|uniref:hypothetical protein n=1 Tax=Paenibacillus sp. LX16 TaxID=1740264 RepID=UPI002E2D011E|nr:hypothetical protein [Paenibacillus sp. LX16]
MNDQWGIWSCWSKKFCFGISAPSAKVARKELYKKIGKDAYKWRFEARKNKTNHEGEMQNDYN